MRLLREPRRALHARIAEALESQFAAIAASQPQLLAHHCTEAGLIEKAAGLWADAGQRSLSRSDLVEGAAQLTRALSQVLTLASSPALRREQIKLQVALANALMHTKGYAAVETKASLDQARLFIDGAEALGESPEDPLLLLSVVYGSYVRNFGICAKPLRLTHNGHLDRSSCQPITGREKPATSLTRSVWCFVPVLRKRLRR